MMRIHAGWGALGALVGGVAFAANGDLDASFGDGGIARAMNTSGGPAGAYGPVVDADGRILVCDRVDDGGATGIDMLVARFTADGVLDASFSFDGKAVVDFDAGAGFDYCGALAVQADGKIVVAGTTYANGPESTDAAVARFNADGSLDTTFGAGSGKVIIGFDYGSSNSDEVTAVAIDAEGRIVIAGSTPVPDHSRDFAVARLLPDGTLDASFNLTGKVHVGFDLAGSESLADNAAAMAIDAAGRIVVAGAANKTPDGSLSNDFAVARLLPDGRLDPDFDADGRATIAFDLGAGNDDQVLALQLMRDGRIVLAGGADTSTTAGTTNYSMAVARMRPDGSLDATFGIGGRTLVPIDLVQNGTEAALGLAVQGNGRILLSGYAQQDADALSLHAASVRLESDGGLDASWGAFGKKTYDFGLGTPSSQVMHGIVVQGGRVIVAGGVRVGDSDIDDFVAVLQDDLIFADLFD